MHSRRAVPPRSDRSTPSLRLNGSVLTERMRRPAAAQAAPTGPQPAASKAPELKPVYLQTARPQAAPQAAVQPVPPAVPPVPDIAVTPVAAQVLSTAGGRSAKRRPTMRKMLVTGSVLAVAAVLGGIFMYSLQPKASVPASVKQNVPFNILAVTSSSNLEVPEKTFRYDNSLKVLTYIAEQKNGNKIVFTQQKAPEKFSADPKEFQKFLDSINVYKQIETSQGKAYLAKPEVIKGEAMAVVSREGTLLFARPNSGLTESEWRAVIERLKLTK